MSTIARLSSWLARDDIRRRIVQERLTEPIHLNLASLFVAAFGSTRAKIDFDLLPLRHYAHGMLAAADLARAHGYRKIVVLEFGVAAGRGLLNMASLAPAIAKETGVAIRVAGFDGGYGLPPPKDVRDLPSLYRAGDFPMDAQKLRAELGGRAELILGEFAETIPRFLAAHGPDEPIGFVSIDVDLYSSTVAALEMLAGESTHYLPVTLVHFDDITEIEHSRWNGELRAIDEFNDASDGRKLEPLRFLRQRRIMKNAWWPDQTYSLHVFDHPLRAAAAARCPKHV